jgi:hypothetical protein
MNRREFLRRSSGVLVPAAATIFVPQFGSWFKQLFAKKPTWEWDNVNPGIWSTAIGAGPPIGFDIEMFTSYEMWVVDRRVPKEHVFVVHRSYVDRLKELPATARQMPAAAPWLDSLVPQ